jgi:hypothetical protein
MTKYYKKIGNDNREYIIRRFNEDECRTLSHSNAVVVLVDNEPTSGWFRSFSEEDFAKFEPLDTAEVESKLPWLKVK